VFNDYSEGVHSRERLR